MNKTPLALDLSSTTLLVVKLCNFGKFLQNFGKSLNLFEPKFGNLRTNATLKL